MQRQTPVLTTRTQVTKCISAIGVATILLIIRGIFPEMLHAQFTSAYLNGAWSAYGDSQSTRPSGRRILHTDLLNMALIYRRTGHLLKMNAAFQAAGQGAKVANSSSGRKVGEPENARLSQMYAHIERREELATLLEQLRERHT